MKKNLDHVLLPEEKILELILAYRAGDQDAAQTIIAHNERAIYRIAQRYHSTGVCGDVQIEDLMQLGRMGLLRALQDYKAERGNRFLTYAWQWIRMYISRYGKLEGQRIGFSYHATEQRGKLGGLRNIFVQENSREPSTRELALLSGLKEEVVQRLVASVSSLDATLKNGRYTFGETIPSPDSDFTEEVDQKIVVEAVLKKLDLLPVRLRRVIVFHYGLNGQTPLSLHGIAKKMKLSPERVRQIKDTALQYLRNE